eukprot:CAMPEP_0177650438 /NCGR_PEP_ID=MMETSP0447-20121125/11944_1 /TAXON_ID=0 /ORGANISM="Stygamoeba regulata, Strain BSH-02190019" /LENGTH=289 /DNA_ID=CAMNT_0019153311 /DNA_START=267 /DNA_END=1134 /DNA_ORIENTATION=+
MVVFTILNTPVASRLQLAALPTTANHSVGELDTEQPASNARSSSNKDDVDRRSAAEDDSEFIAVDGDQIREGIAATEKRLADMIEELGSLQNRLHHMPSTEAVQKEYLDKVKELGLGNHLREQEARLHSALPRNSSSSSSSSSKPPDPEKFELRKAVRTNPYLLPLFLSSLLFAMVMRMARMKGDQELELEEMQYELKTMTRERAAWKHAAEEEYPVVLRKHRQQLAKFARNEQAFEDLLQKMNETVIYEAIQRSRPGYTEPAAVESAVDSDGGHPPSSSSPPSQSKSR